MFKHAFIRSLIWTFWSLFYHIRFGQDFLRSFAKGVELSYDPFITVEEKWLQSNLGRFLAPQSLIVFFLYMYMKRENANMVSFTKDVNLFIFLNEILQILQPLHRLLNLIIMGWIRSENLLFEMFSFLVPFFSLFHFLKWRTSYLCF